MMGFHIFRHLMPENFDILVRRMIDGGYAVSNEEEITERPLSAYKKSYLIITNYWTLKKTGANQNEKSRKSCYSFALPCGANSKWKRQNLIFEVLEKKKVQFTWASFAQGQVRFILLYIEF